MSYSTSNSEKFFFNTPAGLFDASSSLNSTYFLAEGLLNAGYGALIRSGFNADQDVYHLGTLSPGSYTLDVDGNNWDFSNSVFGFDTYIAQFGIVNSAGYWIDYTTSSVSELSFTLDSSTDVYAVVKGQTWVDAEYRIFYTFDGALNSPAVWGAPASYTGSLISGQEIDASVTYSDADGNSDNIVATWWYLDGVYQTASETFTLTDDHVGQTLTFRFAFYDDAGNLEASNSYTAGEVVAANSPAIWGSSASYTGSLISGQEIDASVTYSDADGNSDNIVATWWYLDGVYQTTAETFTLTDDHVGQTLTFRFSFYDDAGNLEASNAYSAGFIANINDDPVVTSSAVTSIDEDASYSYTFTASDVDVGDTVTLSAQTKPDWLSFDAGTGVLSGTPTNDAVGDHSVVLRATDGAGAYAEQSFTVAVSNVNDDPTFSYPSGPLLAGVLAPDETIAVYLHDLDDVDGITNAIFEYQWFINDVEIEGAENSSYKITDKDVGKKIGVKITYQDDAGFTNSVYQKLDQIVVDESVSVFEVPVLRYGANAQVPYFIGVETAKLRLRDDDSFAYVYDAGSDLQETSLGGMAVEYDGYIIPNFILEDRGISRLITSDDQYVDAAYMHLDGVIPSIPDDIENGVSSLLIPLGATFDFLSADSFNQFVTKIIQEVEVPESAIYGPGKTNWLKQIASDLQISSTVNISMGEDSPTGLGLEFIGSSASSKTVTADNGTFDYSNLGTFSHVVLESATYNADIAISDVISSLKHIVGLETLDGAAFHAADVDNDDTVAIADVISQLRHIVGLETLNTFDLVDMAGERVTEIIEKTTDLQIVLNGDVDLSTALASEYILVSDIT